MYRWGGRRDGAPEGHTSHGDSAVGKRTLTGTIQRKASGGAAGADGDALDRAGASSGAQLPESVRSPLEGSFGVDLGGVRVHTGEASGQAAASVAAQAYTVGQDIHF